MGLHKVKNRHTWRPNRAAVDSTRKDEISDYLTDHDWNQLTQLSTVYFADFISPPSRTRDLPAQNTNKSTSTDAPTNQNLNRMSPAMSVPSVNVLKVLRFLPGKGHSSQYFPAPSLLLAAPQNVRLVWPDNFGPFSGWCKSRNPDKRRQGMQRGSRTCHYRSRNRAFTDFASLKRSFFFLRHVFVPSGTKTAPTITRRNKYRSCSSQPSDSTWSAGVISQETQSLGKKWYCKSELLHYVGFLLCVKAKEQSSDDASSQPVTWIATGCCGSWIINTQTQHTLHPLAAAHWPGHRGHVVSREDTGGSCSQRCPFEPPILTLLRHPIHLPFPKF